MKHFSAILVVVVLLHLLPAYKAQPLYVKEAYPSGTFSTNLKSDFLLSRPDNSIFNFGTINSKAIMSKYDSTGNWLWTRSYFFNHSTNIFDNDYGDFKFVEAVNSHDSTLGVVARARIDANTEAYCLKLKANGDTVWCRKVICDNATSMTPRCISSTIDSGFVLCGTTNGVDSAGISLGTSFVAKLTKTGTLNWIKRIKNYSKPYTIKQTNDSGYIYIGNGLLTKLDKSGNLIWQSELFTDTLTAYLKATFDLCVENNGYLFVAQSSDNRPMLVKTDLFGNALWAKKYSLQYFSPIYSVYDRPFSLKKHTANSWLIMSKGIGLDDSWIMTVDSLGNVQMQEHTHFISLDVVSCRNKNLAVFGSRYVGHPYYAVSPGHIGIVITNSTGVGSGTCAFQTICTSSVHPVNSETLTAVVVAGGMLSAIHPTLGSIGVLMDEGCLLSAISGGMGDNSNSIFVSIYPNPSTGKIEVRSEALQGKKITFKLLDISGRLLMRKEVDFRTDTAEVDLSAFNSAMYLYTLSSGSETIMNGKIVLSN
jgi:hypothetical protein